MNNIIKKIMIMLFIIITGYYAVGKYMNSGVEEIFFVDIYLYLWNGNLNISFLLVFLLGIQELCVMDSYGKVNNAFDKYIIIRTGYLNYYALEYRVIIIKSLFYYFVTHFILVIAMLLKYGYRSASVLDEFKYHLFNQDQMFNIVMFILLSAVGVAIFNCFIFSFSTLIKNKYVYRFLPLIFLFASILISAVFSTFIQNIFGYSEFVKTIGLMLSVPNLIQPGMAFMMHGYTSFFSSALCYLIMFAVVFGYSLNLRLKYDQ